MPVSDRVRISMENGSWIRRMFEEGTLLKEKYGAENVFDLTLGNPVMEPPPEFHRELKKKEVVILSIFYGEKHLKCCLNVMNCELLVVL